MVKTASHYKVIAVASDDAPKQNARNRSKSQRSHALDALTMHNSQFVVGYCLALTIAKTN
jgi:hypothetical protein